MALSPASGLANYSSGISSSVLTVDSNSDRVGIGTTNPQDTLQVGTAITMGSGTVTATQGNFQNVSIAGTLTYEDTTSVDSVGIITARSGISITGGGLSVVGNTDLVGNLIGVNATGISTIVNLTSTNVSVTGVTTLGNTVVGGGTTQLVVNGDARITGILTMGTSSITLDGTQNKIISGKYDFLGISTSHTDTAVDVFLYDTSRDSDGGEWRKRTSDTSWYNETLNTATRGSRREFPSVAVIVTEDAKVTIYDGDDPDLPMWMVFNAAANNWLYYSSGGKSSVMLNGKLANAAGGSNQRFRTIDFVSDSHREYSHSDGQGLFSGGIDQRNSGSATLSYSGTGLVDRNCNDVAMTVLPNAPIDDATGLPIPTIAVATDGGISVIKDDGTVVDLIQNHAEANKVKHIDFDSKTNAILWTTDYVTGGSSTADSYKLNVNPILSTDYTSGSNVVGTFQNWNRVVQSLANLTKPHIQGDNITEFISNGGNGSYAVSSNGTNQCLNLLYEFPGSTVGSTSELNAMVAYVTTSYNSGWMYRDIKGAFLSSNVATAVTFTNLATNGDFGQSSDVASWTAYNATLTHQTDAIRVADNGSFSKAYQSFTTVDGRRYIATVNCKTLSGSDAILTVGNANPAQTSWNNNGTIQVATAGVKSLVFTASGTTNYIELGSSGGGFAEYNNVRIDEVKEEDRSVNNNPLEVYGTITKSAVATGADLVAYSGFSASTNYLSQPPNSDLAIGNSDFSSVGWFKKSTSSNTGVIFWSGNGSGQVFDVRVHTDMKMLAQITDDGFSTRELVSAQGSTVNDDIWHQYHVVRRSNVLYLYLDGNLLGQSSAVEANITDSMSITIGAENTYADQKAFEGSISLIRFSKSAPSPEQIKKIYEDEKVLFQENAKATIYGSFDTVTALTYDEVTDQLHVGTSSGRSDFQGLRRINNTTVGITSAISAHDSFIIEQ